MIEEEHPVLTTKEQDSVALCTEQTSNSISETMSNSLTSEAQSKMEGGSTNFGLSELYSAGIADYSLRRKWMCHFFMLVHTFLLSIVCGSRNFLQFSASDQLESSRLNQKEHTYENYLQVCNQDFRKVLCAARYASFGDACAAVPVVAIFIYMELSARLVQPEVVRKIWSYQYDQVAENFSDPRWIRDTALAVRPLMLGPLLLCPLVAILMMIVHFVSTFMPDGLRKKNATPMPQNGFVLKQDLDGIRQKNVPATFFHSDLFSPLMLTFFVLGIPGGISWWIYTHLGIATYFGGLATDAPGRELEKILFYFFPLGACLSMLFFRYYFTFGMHFFSGKYDIEVHPDVLKMQPIEGWFRDFVSLGVRSHFPVQIRWSDVTEVTLLSGKLKSLELTTDNEFLRALRRVSTFYESLTLKLGAEGECITVTSHSRAIQIKLSNLTQEEKSSLFYALRKNAPSIFLTEDVQKALTGSMTLQEPRYTQIWFDVLNHPCINASATDLQSEMRLYNDKYVIEEKLGSGGQALVYSAHQNNDTQVVLKEFRLTSGEALNVMIDSAKPFETESTILNQLDHCQIVKMIDMFYENGRVYIVLEKVEGLSLRKLVENSGALSATKVVNLAKQMCAILEYLHSFNPAVLHRDFTPDNLILQPDGQLKLIDFSVSQTSKDVRAGECAGKHSYTPPEQFRGETTTQSDIYALGAMLSFLLTGVDPLPISRSSPITSRPEISAWLNEIVEKATAIDISQRYQSVQWMLLDLEALEGKSCDTDPAVIIKVKQT